MLMFLIIHVLWEDDSFLLSLCIVMFREFSSGNRDIIETIILYHLCKCNKFMQLSVAKGTQEVCICGYISQYLLLFYHRNAIS